MLLPAKDPTANFRVEITKAEFEMRAKHASLEASIDARLRSLEKQVQDHFLKYNDTLVSLEAKMNATAARLQVIVIRAHEDRFMSEAHNRHRQLESCAAAIRNENRAESLRLQSWVREALSDQTVRRCEVEEELARALLRGAEARLEEARAGRVPGTVSPPPSNRLSAAASACHVPPVDKPDGSLGYAAIVKKAEHRAAVDAIGTAEDGISVPHERFMNPGTPRHPPAQTKERRSGGSPRTYITAMKATWTTNSPQMSGPQQGETAPASVPESGAGPADSPRTLVPPQGTPPVRNKFQSSPPTPHLGPNHGPGSQVD